MSLFFVRKNLTMSKGFIGTLKTLALTELVGMFYLAGLILLHPVLGSMFMLIVTCSGIRLEEDRGYYGGKSLLLLTATTKTRKTSLAYNAIGFFLYTQFGSIYLYTARHPSVIPALVQLALRPNSTNQSTKPGLEFLGPALYPTIWFQG